MGQNASGMYIVDDNYNIVGFNTVAEHMYPRLKKEEKCYRCLMNQEVPCAMCPIYNKIEGPKTYIDPVSGHYETVDAVDMNLPDGTHGHALIFGFATADGQKAVNEPLPANKEGLGLTSIINALGSDYRSIYSVDRKTQQVSMYLESNNADEMTRMNDTNYTSAITSYVKENVLLKDQCKLEFAMDFGSLCAHLKRVPQFMVHYRSVKKETGEIHYNYLKCARVGSADSFDTIVLAFANEDADIKRSQLQEIVSPGSSLAKRRILIVEDDTAIREGVAEFLKENEYEVFCAEDGEKALEILKSKEIHLALLDIMLPKKNGIEVLKELRTFSELPVIMLTAVTDEETQVQTFDNLADDYICKPFSLILLLKRIEALLRARYKTENIWKYKDAVVDFSGYRATYLGKDAAVTPKEIKLLAVLLENAGQVVSRDQILDRIWGEEESPFDRVVDVYVKNLRKKLQLDCIITVKGVGYRLELP